MQLFLGPAGLTVFCLLCFLAMANCSHGSGYPPFHVYSTSLQGAGPGNYSISQDQAGVVYIGNDAGVVVYDGENWQLVQIENRSFVQSVCVDSHPRTGSKFRKPGTVWVGGTGAIGYLITKENGEREYHSLMDQLPWDARNFGTVFSIRETEEAVLFHTNRFIFVLSSDELTVLYPEPASDGFHLVFQVDARIFVSQPRVGLMEYRNHELEILPGGDFFSDKFVMGVFRRNRTQLLIFTYANGIWLYEGGSLTEWGGTINEYCRKEQILLACRVAQGSIAVSTNEGSLLLMNEQGDVTMALDSRQGLPEDPKAMYLDREGDLWIPHLDGINRLEINSPFSLFDESANLELPVRALEYLQGTIYVCGRRGVSVKDWKNGGGPGVGKWEFDQLDMPAIKGLSLWATEDEVLGSFTGGFYGFQGKQVGDSTLDGSQRFYHYTKVAGKPGFLLATTGKGLVLLHNPNSGHGLGKWAIVHRFPEIQGDRLSLAQDEHGFFWVSLPRGGVARFRLSADMERVLDLMEFGRKEGFPASIHNKVYDLDGQVIFATSQGILHYERGQQSFQPFQPANEALGEFIQVYEMEPDQDGGIWVWSATEDQPQPALHHLTREREADGRLAYQRETRTFLAVSRELEGFEPILQPMPGGELLMATRRGLLHYQPKARQAAEDSFQALIHQVAVGEGGAAPIFGSGATDQAETKAGTISYEQNSLRFTVAAPKFANAKLTTYRYLLEKGANGQWSDWTGNHVREYGNLREGSYRFQVQARDAFGELSEIAGFKFSIRPPWYRTGLAYAFYVLAAVWGIWLFVWLYTRKLRSDKARLEKEVAARTVEIRQKNKELEELDRVKSRFFSYISHELRTPLTLILSPLHAILSGGYGKVSSEAKTLLQLAGRNTGRLLGTVEEILLLARMDQGKVELTESPVRLEAVLMRLHDAFRSKAQMQDIAYGLELDLGEGFPVIMLDLNKFEKIVNNLLSNAFKYTGRGGSISVRVQNQAHDKLRIEVRDTGKGIHPHDMGRIFDRYYQTSSEEVQLEGGTGIGLAMVDEFVRLMGGNISVESKWGEGSRFVLELPLKLASQEVVDAMEFEIDPVAAQLELFETDAYGAAEKAEGAATILLVEDNEDMMRYLQEILGPHFRLHCARNGKEAWKFLSVPENLPDLVVSDVMMPEMDGFELLEKIKAEPALIRLPMIMLTARTADRDRLRALTVGVDDYLTKPFLASELLVRISNLLKNSALRAEAASEEIEPGQEPINTVVKPADLLWLKEVERIVYRELKNSYFTLDQLADDLIIHKRQLNRKIKHLTGLTPNRYIREIRLQRAYELVENGTYTTQAEIAWQVGFKDPHYFSQLFEERFGRKVSQMI